jgi:hypothetical protein
VSWKRGYWEFHDIELRVMLLLIFIATEVREVLIVLVGKEHEG